MRPKLLFSRKRLAALWPHYPLGLALVLVGALNILDGLKLPLTVVERIQALTSLAESLSALGGTVQVILGVLLVLAGAGLLRRMVSAWTISVLLLVLTVGVNVVQQQWGLTLAFQVLLLAALFWKKDHFIHRTILASIVFSLSGAFAILAYGVFGSYLLGKGFRPPIQDLNTAFYFTVTTLSTVGFGDFVPITTETRWFVVSMLVIGLGVFASVIASAIGPKIRGEFNRLFNPKEKPMELKDHVILVGEGIIARNTAEELKQRGVSFVQIVAAKPASDAPESHRIMVGDATNDATLKDAGIQHARMVVAAREDDGENAFIALGSKDLNPNVRVLAVASSALSIRRLKLARADLVFSPAAVGSRMLADLVEGHQMLPEFKDLLEGHPRKDETK
ncbi:MAG TPA: NAD-binding protein [Verrucomicrobiae bacterium]|nr:NAD-binding protein [Verrucomicrobiae bacterium]